ncbi:MAG: hypothetical protein M0Q92_02160 [Methanoregula sp.]|jgi:hypothetical protein|nr:hypothetical protein [Methanoregula sp.]
MYVWEHLACLFIMLLICTSGCSILSSPQKPEEKQGNASYPWAIETPTLPEQYTARGPEAGNSNPSKPLTIATLSTQKPLLRSAAHTKINGSGLSSNESEDSAINATLAVIANPHWQQNQSTIIVSAVDSTNPVTRVFTLQWPRHGNFSGFENICDLFDPVMDWDAQSQARYSVLDNWTYVDDTVLYGKADYWAPASTTISNRDPVTKNLRGDCDDFAILNAAMVTVIGGNARLVYAVSPSTNGSFCLGHLYAETFVPDMTFIGTVQNRYSVTDVSGYHAEGSGYWIALDWFPDKDGFQHPGASLYDSTRGMSVFYPDGTWIEITPVDDACIPNAPEFIP